MYLSIEERLHDMQQRRIDACINLPTNHPLQPPMIELIQFVPVDVEGAVDHTGSDSANIDELSSHPNSPTQTTETHEPSVIQGLINHYSRELIGYESNLEKASDIASDEVMTKCPHQQTPNQEWPHQPIQIMSLYLIIFIVNQMFLNKMFQNYLFLNKLFMNYLFLNMSYLTKLLQPNLLLDLK